MRRVLLLLNCHQFISNSSASLGQISFGILLAISASFTSTSEKDLIWQLQSIDNSAVEKISLLKFFWVIGCSQKFTPPIGQIFFGTRSPLLTPVTLVWQISFGIWSPRRVLLSLPV
ncbi:hypothetical protein ACFX2C_005025 [Malus domestica]